MHDVILCNTNLVRYRGQSCIVCHPPCVAPRCQVPLEVAPGGVRHSAPLPTTSSISPCPVTSPEPTARLQRLLRRLCALAPAHTPTPVPLLSINSTLHRFHITSHITYDWRRQVAEAPCPSVIRPGTYAALDRDRRPASEHSSRRDMT
eukprot:2686053-Prymnesium_polylepis.1